MGGPDHDLVETPGIGSRRQHRAGADHPAGDLDEDAVVVAP